MIISRMSGGLGGQMFQYAHGRCLADHFGTALKLDLSGIREHIHKFSLGYFNARFDIATREEIAARKPYWLVSKFVKSQPARDCYYDGYYADEKYFREVSDIVREELNCLKTPKSAKLLIAERAIRNAQDSVAIHFRRGDYPTIIGDSYYSRAVSAMCEAHPDATFYVFTDGDIDIRYLTDAVSNPFIFVGMKDYEDIYLMSKCRHHIIANSTFSWWGAWIGKHSGQTVYAPKTWFVQKNMSMQMPDEWIKLENTIAWRNAY